MNLLITLILFFYSFQSPIQNDFNLPKEWTKDFKIIVQNGGGMLDQDTKVTFTYDSCVYHHQLRGKETNHAFALSNAQRTEVLNKMREFNVTKIRPDNTISIAYDKSTSSILLQDNNNFFAASDGATSHINKEDFGNFNSAFNYLTDFAMSKGKNKSR